MINGISSILSKRNSFRSIKKCIGRKIMPLHRVTSIRCLCVKKNSFSKNISIMDFEILREQCSVLRELLIPEIIWRQYRSFCIEPLDKMHHKPILFLAFKRNYLSRFTRLAHEWFFDKNDKLHLIVPQYKKDLIEKWMLEGDYKNRFKNGRIYKSRWAELFFAKWLLDHSWKIVSGSSWRAIRCNSAFER